MKAKYEIAILKILSKVITLEKIAELRKIQNNVVLLYDFRDKLLSEVTDHAMQIKCLPGEESEIMTFSILMTESYLDNRIKSKNL